MKNTTINEQMLQEIRDKSLLEKARRHAYTYLDGTDRRPVYPEDRSKHAWTHDQMATISGNHPTPRKVHLPLFEILAIDYWS